MIYSLHHCGTFTVQKYLEKYVDFAEEEIKDGRHHYHNESYLGGAAR